MSVVEEESVKCGGFWFDERKWCWSTYFWFSINLNTGKCSDTECGVVCVSSYDINKCINYVCIVPRKRCCSFKINITQITSQKSFEGAPDGKWCL